MKIVKNWCEGTIGTILGFGSKKNYEKGVVSVLTVTGYSEQIKILTTDSLVGMIL